jgi:hypothetical protein
MKTPPNLTHLNTATSRWRGSQSLGLIREHVNLRFRIIGPDAPPTALIENVGHIPDEKCEVPVIIGGLTTNILSTG